MYKKVNRKELRKLRKMGFWKNRKKHIKKPRLCVFRSSKNIQAQVIDDENRKVICCAASFESSLKEVALTGKPMAEKIGEIVAKRAIEKGIKSIIFDRNGYAYHGRVQVLADSARKAGLEF